MVWRHHKQIHAVLRKHHPQAVHKAKRLFQFKYPKLLLLILFFIFAYYLFSLPEISGFIHNLSQSLGYVGDFIAGIFISFGFLAPLGIGFFLIASTRNIFLAALLGGLGAMIGDFIIFRTIKFSFM